MNKKEKNRLCAEIEEFLSGAKALSGQHPVWRANGRLDQLDAKWPIVESDGISRAHLAFRYNRVSTDQPSVSLVFQRKSICRVDIKAADESDGNPPQAAKFGLPGRVYGTHIHKWEYNKEYVVESLPPDEWDIPIKQEISQATQKLGHILAFICDECGIEFTAEQRDLNPPTREDLFG